MRVPTIPTVGCLIMFTLPVYSQTLNDPPFNDLVGRICIGQSAGNPSAYRLEYQKGFPVVANWRAKPSEGVVLDITQQPERYLPVTQMRPNGTLEFKSNLARFDVTIYGDTFSGVSYFEGRTNSISAKCQPRDISTQPNAAR